MLILLLDNGLREAVASLCSPGGGVVGEVVVPQPLFLCQTVAPLCAPGVVVVVPSSLFLKAPQSAHTAGKQNPSKAVVVLLSAKTLHISSTSL